MPISGTTKGKSVARLGKMRLGATRLDYYQPWFKVKIAGVDRTANIRIAGGTITQNLDGIPDTAAFRIDGIVPTGGQVIQVFMGDTDVNHCLFGGHILSVTKVYEGTVANLAYDVNCIDYTWRLREKKILQQYTSMSASDIVLSLLAIYAPWVTSHHVVTGLATIDAITFTNEDFPDALDRLATLIGGYWYLDYVGDLHFFLTEDGAAQTVTATHASGWQIGGIEEDWSQLRNRAVVRGGGSNASADVAIGSTTLPVVEGGWYATAGGYVETGQQRLSYTGKSSSSSDGVGSVTAGLAQSPSAPSAALASGSGDVTGTVSYKVLHVLPGGASEVSSASGTVSVSAISAPSAPSASVNTASGGVTVGAHQYKTTFITAKGETLASSASSTATVSAVNPPGAPITVVASSTVDAGLAPGSRKHMTTFVTAQGETLAGDRTSAHPITAVLQPSSLGSITPGTGGSVPSSSTFYIGVSYTTANGDTEIEYGTVSTGSSQNRLSWSSIPTSFDTRVTGRKLWRSKAGGDLFSIQLLTTINDNTTTTYTDNAADASLGAVGSLLTNTTGGRYDLTSIPTSLDARVTARKIYRTAAGGNTYKLLTTIADNTTTTFTDAVADSSLGQEEPAVDTSGGATIAVSSIATSSDARVSRRKLYRTEAGGSVYKLVTTLSDNSTTTYTDNKEDSGLGDVEPVADTSGGGVVTVTVPVGGATVTARKLFRTAAGGSVYKALGSINDNTTTTYTDSKGDANLGDDAPSGSTVRTEAGATSLPVSDATPFASSGWVRINGAMVVRYTSVSGSTLSGIPASGSGSLTAPVTAGSAILNEPFLSGIPASGTDAVRYAITAGDQVNIRVERNDTTSQTTVAAAMGSGDGIVQEFLSDGRIGLTEATARADAELALFKDPIVTINGTTRDQTVRPGRSITFSLTSPAVSGTYKIQRVTLSELAIGGTQAVVFPLRTVDITSVRFSFEDVVRKLIKNKAA